MCFICQFYAKAKRAGLGKADNHNPPASRRASRKAHGNRPLRGNGSRSGRASDLRCLPRPNQSRKVIRGKPETKAKGKTCTAR